MSEDGICSVGAGLGNLLKSLNTNFLPSLVKARAPNGVQSIRIMSARVQDSKGAFLNEFDLVRKVLEKTGMPDCAMHIPKPTSPGNYR